jgi:polyferredoxin
VSVRVFTRRLLSRRLSIDKAVERALTWLLLPYVVIGLTWAFFHPAMIAREEAALQTLLPAGAEIVAYGHVAVLWPVLMIDPDVCPV